MSEWRDKAEQCLHFDEWDSPTRKALVYTQAVTPLTKIIQARHSQVKRAVRLLAMNEKETFVIEYLKKNKFVDVLDAEFMCAFADQFKCKYTFMAIGAPRVPLASRTLSAMFRAGLLDRWVHGLSSYERQGGFPKWVYSYSLAKPTINVIQKVDVKFLKHHYLKYFGHEIPQTQINVFTPEFLDFCLYIIQEASKIDDKK